MLVEQPTLLLKAMVPGAVFRGRRRSEDGRPAVYLTFDDGPVEEVTPWVLNQLDVRGLKATFFMVGDNARRNPGLVEDILSGGHLAGNHTMHHLRGLHTPTDMYIDDIIQASAYIPGRLFRPPHGCLRMRQLRELRRLGWNVIMFDVVSRDYSRRLTAAQVADNVRRYTRPGSLIVFHDSLKSQKRLKESLPAALDWLVGSGYDCRLLTEENLTDR